jgi:NADH:ubiquinone oxidoreductase subunit 4 (subunit M)
MTHAFFKALLFLGAGSVIIGMHHEQDMRKMGGLRKYMPITYHLADRLAGADRHAVLRRLLLQGRDHRGGALSTSAGRGLRLLRGLAGVFVTAFYSFRMYFLVFHGRQLPPRRRRHLAAVRAAEQLHHRAGRVAGWEVITERVAQYMGAFLILSGLMIGVFCALDGVLFYVFFEAMLIPMFLIIGVWGGRAASTRRFKFFLYTLLGSLLMLVAIIYLYYWKSGGTSTSRLACAAAPMTRRRWLWLAFFAAFAVKVPMWPVHTWLPDAHVEAPTGGSVILAAIMLKMGGYGFLRFSLPMFPDASHELRAG